jgi:hypothetical protein
VIRHVVSFRWNDRAPLDQAERVSKALATLPAAIPEIRSFQYGPDEHLAEGNMDYSVIADFDDEDAYLVYRDHAAHKSFFAEHIAANIAERAAVQFSPRT